jgi:hypothetical protein
VMAAKIQYIWPIQPSQSLASACATAHEAVSRSHVDVAIFMIDGVATCTKASSQNYAHRLEKYAKCLVGVYNAGASWVHIEADLREFYKEAR